jgi:uncharacterized membrane protein YecN with MAPEG domain
LHILLHSKGKKNTMVYPVITALTAGIIINIQMLLMMLTGKSRYKYKQGLGEGNHPELLARIRSHGNLAENAAIVLVVLGFLEMSGVSSLYIGIAAGLFIFGRLLHPIGLFKTSGSSLPRAIGVTFTAAIGMIGGIALVAVAIGRLLT